MTTKTPKTTSPAVRGAQLYNKILELHQKRDVELATAPESIAARYKEKVAKLMARYSAEERAVAERLLGE